MAAETTAQTGLYRKLAEVIAEVGYVAKDGKNDFQNYRYTSAEALLAAIRGPLSSRGVVLMPSLTALSEREYTTSKGKASIITTAHVRFTLVDGESGQQHECEWAGQGDDPADKGLGKAYTNAIKTFLREQFLIPQGDDPEADRTTDERAGDRAPASKAVQSNGHSEPTAAPVTGTERPASAKQRGMLNAKAADANLSAADFANAILMASGAAGREFADEQAALTFVNRLLDRLPAKLVDPVLGNISDLAVSA